MNLVDQVNEESSHENYSGAFNKKHAYEVEKMTLTFKETSIYRFTTSTIPC